LFGDEKFFADFLVAATLRDELHNFLFAIAEQRLFAGGPDSLDFEKRLHDFSGHAVVEPDFAGMHAMNAFHQEIGRGTVSTRHRPLEAHGANHVAVVFGGGSERRRA